MTTYLSRFKIGTETFDLDQAAGASIVGSAGTIIPVSGSITNFWNRIDLLRASALNSTGYKTIELADTYYTTATGGAVWALGAKVRQDPSNPTKCFAWSRAVTDGHYQFDDTNDKVTTPLKEITSTGDFTLSFWYNSGATRTHDHVLFSTYKDLNNRATLTIDDSGKIFWEQKEGGRLHDANTLYELTASDAWHHISFRRTYNTGTSTIALYLMIDGVNITIYNHSKLVTIPTFGAKDYIDIGFTTGTAYYGNFGLNNYIAYNKALSAGDLAKLYTKDYDNMTDKPDDPTVSMFWYKCNEAAPAGSEPYTGITLDSSGNASHATPAGVEANKATFFNPVFVYTQALCDYVGQCQLPAKILSGNPSALKTYLQYNMRISFPVCYEIISFQAQFANLTLTTGIYLADVTNNYESLGLLFFHNDWARRRITNFIGYKSERTALTNPTLAEALDYSPATDFSVTDYDFSVGQWVFIVDRIDKTKYEILEIDSIVGTKITFTTALVNNYYDPIVLPCFKALLLGSPSWSRNLGDFYCSLDFMLIRNLDFASYTPSATFQSILVLLETNYYEDRSLGNVLNTETILTDFGFGALEYYKNFKQSQNIKTFGRKATGRTEILNLLESINYLNGQQRLVWIPRLQKDFIPLNDIADDATVIQVNNKGLTSIAASDGFSRAVMLYLNGSYYYSAVTSIVETSATVETLTLATTFGVAVDISEDEFFICWLVKSCLNTDQAEIKYLNQSATAMLNFREQQS